MFDFARRMFRFRLLRSFLPKWVPNWLAMLIFVAPVTVSVVLGTLMLIVVVGFGASIGQAGENLWSQCDRLLPDAAALQAEPRSVAQARSGGPVSVPMVNPWAGLPVEAARTDRERACVLRERHALFQVPPIGRPSSGPEAGCVAQLASELVGRPAADPSEMVRSITYYASLEPRTGQCGPGAQRQSDESAAADSSDAQATVAAESSNTERALPQVNPDQTAGGSCRPIGTPGWDGDGAGPARAADGTRPGDAFRSSADLPQADSSRRPNQPRLQPADPTSQFRTDSEGVPMGPLLLPPALADQGVCGQPVNPSAASEGDLVYWSRVDSRDLSPTRVGIVTAPGLMVTADPTTGIYEQMTFPLVDDPLRPVLGDARIERVVPSA